MPGEFDFIRWIRSQQQKTSERIVLAAGDDLAVMKWNSDDLLLVGVDQVLDGVHFDSAVHAPRLIGRKVMNRNLSDCAAMACLPAGAVATVALPKGTSLDYAKELYLGIKEAGDQFDCPIIGGDTAAWAGKLVVTLTILGKSAGIKPIARSGAKPNQGIYVTGPLGGSLLGRHLTFAPRIAEARALAATGLITAMIDLSDGLSRDIRHIAERSNVGAVLDEDSIPIHPDAIEMSRRDGRSPLEHALHDGEDHELLFVASARIPEELGAIQIGRTTANGIRLRGETGETPLEPKGWEHQF